MSYRDDEQGQPRSSGEPGPSAPDTGDAADDPQPAEWPPGPLPELNMLIGGMVGSGKANHCWATAGLARDGGPAADGHRAP